MDPLLYSALSVEAGSLMSCQHVPVSFLESVLFRSLEINDGLKITSLCDSDISHMNVRFTLFSHKKMVFIAPGNGDTRNIFFVISP